MTNGDFETAWQISDEALAGRDPAKRDDPHSPYHLRWVWDGRPFDGKQVLVRCYHGLGDTLQFCRYLAPLRRRVHRLTVEVQPDLLEVLARVDGPDTLIAFRPEHPAPPSECDIEIMELAHALRLTPTRLPYIGVKRSDRGRRYRVGLCWRANATWSPERSVPAALLTPLLAGRDIEFVSLQRGERAPSGITDNCPEAIIDTARLIATLDLVVSVDTMIAHLAGAMGVPVWLLLTFDHDWRWRAGGLGSVWYRDVRKYRQRETGDWGAPLLEIAADLAEGRRKGTFPFGHAL